MRLAVAWLTLAMAALPTLTMGQLAHGAEDCKGGASKAFSGSPCPGGGVEVFGASAHERNLICSSAAEAIEFFRQCELEIPPVIRIEVTAEQLKVCGVDAFGRTDANKKISEIMDLGTCSAQASSSEVYGGLDPVEFFKSIVAHEVAHQIFIGNAKDRVLSAATHEYVAYAAQISVMPPKVRDRFLASI